MPQLNQKLKPHFSKLQNYLRMDLPYLIKGEFWLMLGRVVGLTTSFLLALAWANWMDKNVYGHYQYILSLTGLVSIFSLPGINYAIIRAAAKKAEGMLTPAFRTQLKWGILASLTTIGMAAYYYLSPGENMHLVTALLTASVFLPLFNASDIYISFLSGKKLFNIHVTYEMITQAIAVAATLSTLFLMKEKSPAIALPLIIAVYFATRTLLKFIFFRRTRSNYQENNKTDKETIPFGKRLTWSSILISTIVGQLDKIILFHYLGAINLAVYSFAVLIPEQVKIFLKHIGTLAMPKLATRTRKEIKSTFLRKIFYLSIFVGASAVIYIIAAPWIYKFLFARYLDAALYSRIYALSLIPLSLSLILAIFKAQAMTKEIYQTQILSSLIRLTLIVVLIPLYGIWGAVFAIIGARTASAVIYLIYFRIRL